MASAGQEEAMSIVVLLSMDGVRPDAIAAADCPNLQGLMERGSFSLKARSLMPNVTLPCHMSIFHSVPPERHGVVINHYQPPVRPIPGIADVAAAAGKRCAFFFNWEPLRDLARPGALVHSYFQANALDREGDHQIVQQFIDYYGQHMLDFAFVYFGAPDEAGHKYGWMSDGYLDQLSHDDVALGRLLDVLPTDATILMQSDHGGHDRTHGTDLPEDMLIPWIIAGPNIKQGHEIQAEVSLLSTAPTLARVMGVTPHTYWDGAAVKEIFLNG